MAFTFGKVTNATNDYDSNSIKDEILNRTFNWMSLSSTADIYIIDDDAGDTYQADYDNSITRLGVSSPTVGSSPNFAQLSGRDLVIWCCGDNYDTENPLDHQDIVMQYLDQSGAQNLIDELTIVK